MCGETTERGSYNKLGEPGTYFQVEIPTRGWFGRQGIQKGMICHIKYTAGSFIYGIHVLDSTQSKGQGGTCTLEKLLCASSLRICCEYHVYGYSAKFSWLVVNTTPTLKFRRGTWTVI